MYYGARDGHTILNVQADKLKASYKFKSSSSEKNNNSLNICRILNCPLFFSYKIFHYRHLILLLYTNIGPFQTKMKYGSRINSVYRTIFFYLGVTEEGCRLKRQKNGMERSKLFLRKYILLHLTKRLLGFIIPYPQGFSSTLIYKPLLTSKDIKGHIRSFVYFS